jgi:hypothetical protein
MRRAPIALSLLATPSLCHAQDDFAQANVSYEQALKPTQTYRAPKTDWLTFGIAGSAGTNDVADFNIWASYSHFVARDVEIVGEIAFRYFEQDNGDAVGINPAVVFRWHFWVSDGGSWSAYVDLGLGVLATTDDVPAEGTSINLTPRAGLGLTRRLDDNARLQLGVRWSHISNGRSFGENDNLGHDGAMLYVGIILPF